MVKFICFGKSGLPNSGQRSARNHYLCRKKFRRPPEIVSESQHILILCGNWWMRQTAAMWCKAENALEWSEAAWTRRWCNLMPGSLHQLSFGLPGASHTHISNSCSRYPWHILLFRVWFIAMHCGLREAVSRWFLMLWLSEIREAKPYNKKR